MIETQLLKSIDAGKFLVKELEKIKYLHFRELNPSITFLDYHVCTKVDFKKIDAENPTETWEKLLEKCKSDGTVSYKYTSVSGSKYFVYDENVIYRMSDHWGAVSSCEWSLEGKGNFMMSTMISGETEIGKAMLKDFQIFRRKEDRKIDILLNPIWKEKIRVLIPLKEKLKMLRDDIFFKERPVKEKKIIGESFGYFEGRLREAL